MYLIGEKWEVREFIMEKLFDIDFRNKNFYDKIMYSANFDGKINFVPHLVPEILNYERFCPFQHRVLHVLL